MMLQMCILHGQCDMAKLLIEGKHAPSLQYKLQVCDQVRSEKMISRLIITGLVEPPKSPIARLDRRLNSIIWI